MIYPPINLVGYSRIWYSDRESWLFLRVNTMTAKAPKLTRKQKKFVKAYVETGVGSEAARQAYDIDPANKPLAAVIAAENLAKPNIIDALERALPDDLLAKIHLEGLFATKTVFKEGEAVAEEADFAVRHKYLDSAYKIKGKYAPEKSVNLNVEVKSEPSPRIIELGKKLNQ